LGLDGELNDKWTRYKPDNAIEANYSWKLHAEPDLGVPLAPAAMNLKCYRDPTDHLSSKNSNKRRKLVGYDDDDDDDDMNGTNENGKKGPPPLHPDDEALINWAGNTGDSAAEQLQIRRDRARAEARAQSQGKTIPKTPNSTYKALSSNLDRSSNSIHNSATKTPNSNRRSFQPKSRVLAEAPQSWMMRTTYISNDGSRKIHDFTSASTIKKRSAMEVDKKMEETKAKIYNPETIEAGFQLANQTSSRKHPTKRHLTPVYDFPLLPDVDTWGHTYTHVVLDKPPKIDSSSAQSSSLSREETILDRISKAFITDVEKREESAKMICKLLAPEHNPNDPSSSSPSSTQEDQHITNYEVTQTYDLDVVPLKDENSPHINFLLVIDEEKQMVRYHPVSSRVQLSTGRPSRPDKSIIEKRTLSESDVQDIEMRVAEVDKDLEDKYAVDGNSGDEDDDHYVGKGAQENMYEKDDDSEDGF